MTNDCRLTTFDNPFDPFEQFTQWFLFDVEKGYNTCSILGRIEQVTDDMSEKESNEEHERAIDTIIDNDFLNIYKKVWRNGKRLPTESKTPAQRAKKAQGGSRKLHPPSMHRAGPQKICGGNFVETIYIFIMWCLEEFTGITG